MSFIYQNFIQKSEYLQLTEAEVSPGQTRWKSIIKVDLSNLSGRSHSMKGSMIATDIQALKRTVCLAGNVLEWLR